MCFVYSYTYIYTYVRICIWSIYFLSQKKPIIHLLPLFEIHPTVSLVSRQPISNWVIWHEDSGRWGSSCWVASKMPRPTNPPTVKMGKSTSKGKFMSFQNGPRLWKRLKLRSLSTAKCWHVLQPCSSRANCHWAPSQLQKCEKQGPHLLLFQCPHCHYLHLEKKSSNT